FRSGYRLGKIETNISWQKLAGYKVIVLGCPVDGTIDPKEIEAIEQFVEDGGGLLFVSDEGGDEASHSNMNEVASKYGFKFQGNVLLDKTNFADKYTYLRINTFERHFVTRDVSEIVFASGCSIEVTDPKVTVLARAGSNALKKDFVEGKYNEETEDFGGVPILVAKKHGKGKVIGMGNFSLLTSLSRIYGLTAADNFNLVGNIFAWLSTQKGDESEDDNFIHLHVALDPDIYFWIEREVKSKQRFESVNKLVNFALNAVRESLDTYDTKKTTSKKRKKS
ncbi:MAG: hypothetical protein ACFFCS_17425, partial [Candidatus Hodarchaeota archaeon]